MNTTPVQQPPMYVPPPQQFMPGQNNGALNTSNVISTPEKQKGRLINIAFYATVAFVVLSNPIAYRFMNNVFNTCTGKFNEIITETGCPTIKGHFIHSVVFFVIIFLLLLKK